MRSILAAILLSTLAACAGQDSPEATTARNICAIAYGDPALDPVRGRIPFEDDAAAKAAMNYLADPDKPNAVERAALAQLDAANRRCWDAWDKAGSSKSPYVQSARAKVSAALGELYSGKSTYGDFNRARGTAIAEMRAAAADAKRNAYGGGGSPFTFGVGLGVFR
jgi:hypothetical protein